MFLVLIYDKKLDHQPFKLSPIYIVLVYKN